MPGSTAKKRAENPWKYTGTWIRPATRLAIYLRDNFRCVHCGKDLHKSPPHLVTLDHVVPLRRCRHAQPNRPSNLVTACHDCNSHRSHGPITKWTPNVDPSWRPLAITWPKSLIRHAHLRRVRRQTRISIAPFLALAKALTRDNPWPVANIKARKEAR